MRRLSVLLLLGVVAVPAAVLPGCGRPTASAEGPVEATHTAVVKIEGMTCASCSVTVRTAVQRLPGIASIEVDVEGGSATVTFDGARVSAEEIAAKITEAGYASTVEVVHAV